MLRIAQLSNRAKIALSTASMTAGNVLIGLGAVAILRITTHQLGPADYGLFALVITYVSLFSLIADLGIAAITTRELARKGADRSAVLSVALSSRVVLSIAAIPIILISAEYIYPHQNGLFRIALAVMSLDVLFTTIQVTACTAFLVEVRGDIVAVISVVNRALYVGGVVLVAIVHGTYLGYVCAYVGADCTMAAICVFIARRTISIGWNSELRRWWATAKMAFPLGAIQFVGNIYAWIDSILVSILRSSIQLGYYSIAFNMVNVLGMIPSFLMQSLIPSIVDSDRTEVERLVNKASYVLYCIGALLAAGGIVLRVDIITVLAGIKFLPAATSFAILIATLPISFLQTVLGFTSVSIDRYRPLVIVSVATLALNIGVNLAVIPEYGASGAAATLLGSEVVSLVATYFVFRHLSGVRLRWRALWRPTVAAGAAVTIALARESIWSDLGPALALLVGGTLVAGVYLLTLLVVRGFPEEFRRSGRRSQRFQHRRRR